MLVNEKEILKTLSKKSMKDLYKIAYECVDNIKAERYPYVIKEVFNRYMANKITAEEFKKFNSDVSKRQPNIENFRI